MTLACAPPDPVAAPRRPSASVGQGASPGPRGRWRGRGAAWLLAALAALAPPHALAEPEPAIAVVMAPGQALPLSAPLVAAIYRRKRQLWDDQSRIAPVNLPATHPLRRQFSLWLLKRSPEELQDYWNDQYFHGVLPPPVLASEEAVIRFVAATPGAVGYVSACSLDRRVSVVAWVNSPDGNAPCPAKDRPAS